MTEEEKAEEWLDERYLNDIGVRKLCKEAFLAGLKAGKETKWHDLKKDHSDLPEPYATVLDEDGNRITYQGEGKWTFYSDYYGMDIDAILPVAWCEIPTFIDKE